MNFIIGIVTGSDQSKASDVIKDTHKGNIFIDKIVGMVELALLRQRIKCKRAFWTKEQQGQIRFFQDQLSMVAVDIQQNEDARAAVANKGKRRHEGISKNGKKGACGAEKDKKGALPPLERVRMIASRRRRNRRDLIRVNGSMLASTPTTRSYIR